MTRPSRRFALSAVTTAAWLAWAPAHAVTFSLTDLGVLPGDTGSYATGVNNLGQVVGVSVGAFQTAVIWNSGPGPVELSRPGGFSLGATSVANGINDSGRIVGWYQTLGGGVQRAFSWAPGNLVDLPVASPGLAAGINHAGLIVGQQQIGPGVLAGFVYNAGVVTDIGNLGGPITSASDINDHGLVAGTSRSIGPGGFGTVPRAVRWSESGGLVNLDPTSTSGSTATALNNRGQVVGAMILSSSEVTPALWQSDGSLLRLPTLPGALISSQAMDINDAGQVVGWAGRGGERGWLWSERAGLVDLNDRLSAGTALRMVSARAINQLGQIAGLANNSHAVLLTPTGDLAWQGANGDSFSEGRNWELGLAPNKFLDAQVYTAGAQLITLGRDTTVNSLGLGGAAGGRPMLALQDGATLSATYGVTVRATGTLTGDGRVAGAVVNQGTVLASNLRIDGTLNNQGLVITQSGVPGRLATDLDNQASGQLRVGSAEVMVLSGASHRNIGTIEVRGGELEVSGTLANETGGRLLVNGGTLRFNDGLANRGEVNAGFNGAEFFGRVLQGAGGRLVLSGRSNSTFYDAVDIGAASELRVSAGATALFFGTVQQRSGALFTGTGTKFYEGGLSVGASPGLGTDEGSVVFGGSSLYLAEIGGTTAGSGFDKLLVAGDLHFGGTLKLVSWAGFAAQAGQRFDLFDWGSAGGSFSSIDASGLALPDGLMLDTSHLYVDGSVAVVSVPEPASWALSLGGLLVVARLARRRC